MPAPKKTPAAKPTGRVIDLDARRKARAEVQGEPVTLLMGGKKFALPAVMPADFALYAQEEKLRLAIQALLGVHADAFFALPPSMADIEDLVDLACEAYGLTPGEA